MKTKTKISKQEERKTNPGLVETIRAGKKHKAWMQLAGILASSRKNWRSANLNEIEKETKLGDIIAVPGKILSQGDVTKKIRVVAFSFSKKAKEKLLNSKTEIVSIIDEIKKNPEAKGVKFLK